MMVFCGGRKTGKTPSDIACVAGVRSEGEGEGEKRAREGATQATSDKARNNKLKNPQMAPSRNRTRGALTTALSLYPTEL